MGHQPLGLASPLAFLRRAGFAPECLDLSVAEAFSVSLPRARVVAISVPMHTALRLGIRVAQAIRQEKTGAHIVFHGLYAPLHATYLSQVADSILGENCEEDLVEVCMALEQGKPVPVPSTRPKRQAYVRADRGGLPPLQHYVKLLMDGEERVAGSVEATRGCRHLCRHCPVPALYNGRFFAIPKEVVLADALQQVAAGARHLSFRDPDFLNAPKHSLAILSAIHAAHPDLTFDVTAKVEHLLRHRDLLPILHKLGCVIIVSAFESMSDFVLAILHKGHTRVEAALALGLVRAAGISLRPTFVAFTPWTTLADYLDLCHFVLEHELEEEVDPVQLSLRLLLPPGSLLLSHPELQPYLGALDEEALTHVWTHPDPRMERLCVEVSALVEQAVVSQVSPVVTFANVHELAARAAGRKTEWTRPAPRGQASRHVPPRLSEPWFC